MQYLFVILSIVVKLWEKIDQLVLVTQQDVHDRLRLVWVSDKHLQQTNLNGRVEAWRHQYFARSESRDAKLDFSEFEKL